VSRPTAAFAGNCEYQVSIVSVKPVVVSELTAVPTPTRNFSRHPPQLASHLDVGLGFQSVPLNQDKLKIDGRGFICG